MNKLTVKQENFCQAYIRLGDKSAAYREAYNCQNMKAETVNRNAFELFDNNKITTRILELQKQVAEVAKRKLNIDAEEMLRHLNILRQARIDEYVEYKSFEIPIVKTITTGTGKNKVTETVTTYETRTELRFKPFEELTKEQLMCIESIKQNRYGEIELKLHGKEWSIEKINKHIGFYKADNDQSKPEVVINWNEQKTYEKKD